ncbi:MAG: integrin alpha, partial [Chitinophagaceae bacterium]
MKSLYLFMAGLLAPAVLFLCMAQSPNQIIQQKIKSQQVPSLPTNVSTSWYNGAVKNIEKREYNIKSLQGTQTFGAFNRRQQLGFQFEPKGYSVKKFNTDKELATEWQVDFNLQRIGRENSNLLSTTHSQAVNQKDILEFNYAGAKVEYLNDENGMRQNFIVQERPGGSGILKVVMDVKTSLDARTNNSTLTFYTKDKPQDVQLMYDGLKAWDANHTLLPATMEFSDGRLSINVNDRNAVYPVTIDPLNHTPGWTDNGQGLVFPLLDDLAAHLLYGFTVSGAGDVNNDTFDDIIVGAPAYVDIVNISGGTFNAVSVGAAFIYYGSGSGPALTPSEALQ